MQRVLVLGAGKIGSLIATLLVKSGVYEVFLTDVQAENARINKLASNLPSLNFYALDAKNQDHLHKFIKKNAIGTIVSSLPFYCNEVVAKVALAANVNYFDLTEDVKTAKFIREISKGTKSVFIPQCGLAPGFISIVANDLMQHFSSLETVKMRVGALPINASNSLQYSLTWSTDGLINEYGNHCDAIEDGEFVTLLPLDDLEEIKIDGLTYEAFNTSGGIGTLARTWQGRVESLSYKTIRYPGHCAKMRFLMNDLSLNHDRDTLKKILERSIPNTLQDVVLVYVSVTGMQDRALVEENYVRKFYPESLAGMSWSAIQMTTASSLCAVLDLVLSNQEKYKGFLAQEIFSLNDITQSRFGNYYC